MRIDFALFVRRFSRHLLTARRVHVESWVGAFGTHDSAETRAEQLFGQGVVVVMTCSKKVRKTTAKGTKRAFLHVREA